MSSQTEGPLVPGHVGFNDAHTFLDAEAQCSSPSKSQSQLPTQNKGSKVAEVNIGNERRKSVVREEEVGDDEDEGTDAGERNSGGVVGMVDGEGQKAMREGREVI